MVQLMHVHTVDTRPFLPSREGPGDEARRMRLGGTYMLYFKFEVNR